MCSPCTSHHDDISDAKQMCTGDVVGSFNDHSMVGRVIERAASEYRLAGGTHPER